MRTHCSSQLTYSRHYATTNIFIFNRFDLFTNCMVFSYLYLFFIMYPFQRKLVVLLIFQFASFIALFYTSIVNVEASLRTNQNALFLIHQFMLENERVVSRKRRIQSYERAPVYTNIDLIGSYINIVFKQRFRMTKKTFKYVCQQVRPLLIKIDTNQRRAISVETRVAIAITRLASNSPLYIIVDSCRVGV